MTKRFGVFATEHGWLLVLPGESELYPTQTDALKIAVRRAHIERWRGWPTEVVAQDDIGGPLQVIDPPRRPLESLRA